MMKRLLLVNVMILICLMANNKVKAGISQLRNVHAGFTGGIGFPNTQISNFRYPISVLGGCFVNFRLLRNYVVQFDGYGLYTFNLGTIDNQGGKLRFNMGWASVDLMRRLRMTADTESFITIGIGGYHLYQAQNEDEKSTTTVGMSLAMMGWSYKAQTSTVFELRWHILFNPDPKPQVLTLTFGLML